MGTLSEKCYSSQPVKDRVCEVFARPLQRTSHNPLGPLPHLLGNQLLIPKKQKKKNNSHEKCITVGICEVHDSKKSKKKKKTYSRRLAPEDPEQVV